MLMISDRIDGVTEIGEEWLKEELPAPTSIKVSLSDACQFRCGFCSHKDSVGGGVMPWWMFKELVDEMVVEGIGELGLFYIGEPMLAKNLVRAVRYAKEKGIKYVFLTTNGALAKKEKVRELMEAGLDSL